MASRTCERCGKEFRYPAHLVRHSARATPCAPILEKEDLPPEILEDPDFEQKKCRFCGRVFSSYTSMRRHVRTNCKIAPNEKNGDDGMERLYEHTLRKQQTEIAELKARMEAQNTEMMGMMRQLVAQVGTSVAQQQAAGEVAIQGVQGDVAVDNSKRIVINVFGQEGLAHVTAERIKAILDESLQVPAIPAAANTAVLKTAMLVYSDPERPENLTCYLPMLQSNALNDALVHMSREDGTTGWEVQPTTLVLPPMAQKSVDALFDHQPFEDADQYTPLMKELQNNEARYTAGGELRPVLVRNKDLLARALETLPVAGIH